jgi:hypothetical protein
MASRSFAVGDKVVVDSHHLPGPLPGTIVAVTSIPGKTIGVELDHPLGLHTCDNLCGKGYGIWATATEVYAPAEYRSRRKALTEAVRGQRGHHDSVVITDGPEGEVDVAFD